MNGVRIDKWLWAARFFKTRQLAAKACELGRVLSNNVVAKAAREVKLGDTLMITNDGGEFVIEVLALSDVRGPAATAQALYRETEASIAARAKAKEDRKLLAQWEVLPAAKPNKRDRRTLAKHRGRIIGF
jgi:ribosome-associated heat shock protein Hsp15